MKLAVILDPLESIKTYKDSTYAMMREAAARGHELFVMQQQDVVLSNGAVTGFACKLTLLDDEIHWYTILPPQPMALKNFDSVLMRKDPPFDMEYIYSTYLLELAEQQGARIFNRPGAIRDYNEKLSTAKFPEFTPPTLVTRQAELLRAFIAEHGDAILKPLDGMGGMGIFRLHNSDHNINVIIETLTQMGTRTIMAQRYIPEISKGDKRILVIDGKPADYALARIPKDGETRGNLAAGGKGVAQKLSERDRAIAEAIGPTLRDEGLMLVGLDVIGDFLTEINVTSPTCMQEIFQQTGYNIAALMIDALEKSAKK
ncbi:MAG: glutathione synthase [Burkholderiales bacterium]